MDLLLTIARRLSIALGVFVLGLAMLPQQVRASSNPSYDWAMASCQDAVATFGHNNNTTFWQPGSCQDLGGKIQLQACSTPANGAHPAGYCYDYSDWNYSGSAPPSTACTTVPSVSISVTGAWSPGQSFQQTVSDPTHSVNGQPAQIKCTLVATMVGVPTLNPYDGKWYTQVTFTPNASPAGGGGSDGAVSNADGTPDATKPPVPTPIPSTSQPSPKVCGGMCYDPNTDTYSYTDAVSGKSISVDGNTARSASGGCASGASGTICSGSPSAPLPPAPPASPISDPATEVQSVDKTVQKNPTTGGNQTVTTVVYGTPGNKNTSGQQTGDKGPASSSSAPNNGNASGGGDCNTPPSCSGDAVNCGIMRQEWYAMCSAKTSADQLFKGVAGDGNGPPSFASDQNKYGQSDVWGAPDGSQDGTVGGQANQGNYDQSGFGFNQACPMTDLQVPFFSGTFAIPLSQGCVIGPWLRALIIGFALFSAARITAGGRG